MCVGGRASGAERARKSGQCSSQRAPPPSTHRPPCSVHTNQPPHNPRWEALSLSRALDRMSDVAYCPRCEAVCVEDGDHCAQCERCLYVFCTFCSDSYHPGTECLDPHEVRGGGA